MAEPNNDPLMQEIEDELRQEQMKKLWDNYGKYVIALAVVVIVTVAGYQGWQTYDRSQRMESTDRLVGASLLAEDGEDTAAIDVLSKLENDSRAGIATLARLRKASLLAEQGDHAGAAEAYRAIAADGGAPSPMQDLATVLGAGQALNADSGNAQQVLDDLAPLRTETGAWRFSAREISAVAAIELGQKDKASDFLSANALDAQAPGGVRSRAQELLKVIGQ